MLSEPALRVLQLLLSLSQLGRLLLHHLLDYFVISERLREFCDLLVLELQDLQYLRILALLACSLHLHGLAQKLLKFWLALPQQGPDRLKLLKVLAAVVCSALRGLTKLGHLGSQGLILLPDLS